LLQRVVAGTAAAAHHDSPVLARVRFGREPTAPDRGAALDIRVPLDVLGGDDACCDLFPARGPVRFERVGDIDVSTDDRLLVGSVRLEERAAGGLRAATQRAYASIFTLLDRSECRIPLRFWNYVPRINETLDGLERYRHFNIGRQEAFLAADRAAFDGAPAACAIGSQADAPVVYFVAAREAAAAVENPRQISAYRYPADYGPRSPTFSRATLQVNDAPVLFISGTASIVGHRSEHPGDPAAQTHETLVNIQAVVDAANARIGARTFTLDALACTVYVRRHADLETIRAQFMREVGAASCAARNALFLQGDVCRAELLVEIEATGHAG
jgi:chorismate lyase / 3-hydroxybenzoate synthase